MPLLLVGLVAGCTTSSLSAPNEVTYPGVVTAVPAVPSAAPDSDGHLIAIVSDNVSAAGYDAATRTMTVVFDSGATYEYSPVDPSIWRDFLAAQPHPWSLVGNPRLVDAGVPYRRIS